MWLLETLKWYMWLTLFFSRAAGLDGDSAISPCTGLAVKICVWTAVLRCGAHISILFLVHNQSCGCSSCSGSLSLCPIDCSLIPFLRQNHLILSCGFPTSHTQAALFTTLPQQVLTELCSASWPLLFFPASFSPFPSRTGTQQMFRICILAHFLQMSFSRMAVLFQQPSFGDKWLLPNALSQFILVPHGMKFVDGTKSLPEVYLLKELIMILIKTTTIAIYWVLLLARMYTRYIIDISYLTLTTTSQSMIRYDRWQKLGSMTLYPLPTVLARKWWTCDLNLDLFPKSLLLPITLTLPPGCSVTSQVGQLQVGIQCCISSDIYKQICCAFAYCFDDSAADIQFSWNSDKDGIMDFMSPISYTGKTELQQNEVIHLGLQFE